MGTRYVEKVVLINHSCDFNNSKPSMVKAKIGKEKTPDTDRKSTRLNSSHTVISYAVFCLKKKKPTQKTIKTFIHQHQINTKHTALKDVEYAKRLTQAD